MHQREGVRPRSSLVLMMVVLPVLKHGARFRFLQSRCCNQSVSYITPKQMERIPPPSFVFCAALFANMVTACRKRVLFFPLEDEAWIINEAFSNRDKTLQRILVSRRARTQQSWNQKMWCLKMLLSLLSSLCFATPIFRLHFAGCSTQYSSLQVSLEPSKKFYVESLLKFTLLYGG